MKRKIEEKRRAISLREQGYSLNEIVKELGVAKGSASVWVRNISLTNSARERLLTKIKLGQLISAENKRKKTEQIIASYKQQAINDLQDINFDKTICKLICSLLYWCEGAKNTFNGVRFTNSDPQLIKTFLTLFRRSFPIDESKIRVCLHLHEYHKTEKQIAFWSSVARIPKNQFIKPFLKPHTGKRIRKNYPGCSTIYYHSNQTARELLATATIFLEKMGGIVQRQNFRLQNERSRFES